MHTDSKHVTHGRAFTHKLAELSLFVRSFVILLYVCILAQDRFVRIEQIGAGQSTEVIVAEVFCSAMMMPAENQSVPGFEFTALPKYSEKGPGSVWTYISNT